MTSTRHVPRFNSSNPRFLSDPIAFLRTQASEHSVIWIDETLEVLDPELMDRLVRDRRLLNDQDKMLKVVGLEPSGPADRFRREMLLSQNGPRHVALRATVAPLFAPGRVEEFRPVVRTIIKDLMGALPRGVEVDLFEEVCAKVPALLFCHLAGLPKTEASFVTRISDEVLKIFLHDPAHRHEIETAYTELFAYVSALIADRTEQPGDDLVSHLIRKHDAGALSRDELSDMIVMLLEASTDNTSNQMGLVVAAFLTEKTQLALLRRDPGLISAAVHEGIRQNPRVLAIRRTTPSAMPVADVDLPAGTEIRLSAVLSHRSAERFPSPDEFDITRNNLRMLLTFGGGAHACLGAPLAMIEIEEMLKTIAFDHPELSLAGEPERFQNLFVAGVTRLPVMIPSRPAAEPKHKDSSDGH